MASTPDTPLVFLDLLTGPKRQLGGVRWNVGPGQAATLTAWAASEPLLQVAKTLPTLIDAARWATLPAELTDVLQATGVQSLETSQTLDGRSGYTEPAEGQWVQGAWYLQAPTQPSAAQAASRTQALRLVQLVQADADTRELEEAFRADVALSYHLLRLVNSLAVGGSREITSFSQAILMLGRQQLRRWLNLMLFAARADDPRSGMLMPHVACRARLIELLAREVGLDKTRQDQGFLCGMFSLLGTLFGLPSGEVLAPLNLGEDVKAALLHHEGELGRLLALAERGEAGDEEATRRILAERRIAPTAWNQAQVQACAWMLELTLSPATT